MAGAAPNALNVGGAVGGAALGSLLLPGVGTALGAIAGAGLGYGAGSAVNTAQSALSPKAPGLIQPISQPRVLPTFNSASVQTAQNNALLALQSRSGRQSTLLTSNTFGG